MYTNLVHLSGTVFSVVRLYPVYRVVIIEGVFVVLPTRKHYNVFVGIRVFESLSDLSGVTLVDDEMNFPRLAK